MYVIYVRYLLKDNTQSDLLNVRDSGGLKDLTHFREWNQNKLIIADLNVSFLSNKLELLTEKTKVNVLIFETKVDKSFPDTQFKVDGFDNPIELLREYLPIKVR